MGEKSSQYATLDEELGLARAALQQTTGERKLWRQELDRLEAQNKQMDGLSQEKKTAQKARVEAGDLLANDSGLPDQPRPRGAVSGKSVHYTHLSGRMRGWDGWSEGGGKARPERDGTW